MKNDKKPKIRFKGFDDDWEQRKFGELYKKSSEKNDGSVGMDKNITVATMQYKEDVKVSTEEYLRTYYTFNLGDIAFEGHQSKEFRFGRFVENDIGDGIVSHIFAVFRPIVDYDLKFWKYAINNESLMQRVLSRSTKASTMMHDLVTDDFLKQTFLVPSVEEQKQIGEFLAGIDNLITLHQRKCDKLQKIKKSMLEKMFPQNESKKPEIRFKGFNVDWEQRKLGELVDRVVRKNTNNESTLPLTISAQYGLVDQITYFNNRVASRDVSNYYLVLNGEFAYNKSTSDGYPFGAVKRLDLYEKGVLSTLYIVFAPKKEQQIDSDYLTVFFDTDRWHKGVAERAAEGARNHGLLNISAEDFFDIDLFVPKDIVEQKQIGAFIRQLDNLITLHQRELEKMKYIKKSMLEKMFV